MDEKRTTRRVALVTGANKGIGFHIAQQLARRGAVVVLGSRDRSRGEQAVAQLRAEGLDVEVVTLDVTDDASVELAATQVGRDHGRLDILVNNAGIGGGLASSGEVTRTDLRATFETNVFGVAAVTNHFLPLLRAADRARVVILSSELGSPRLMSDPDGPFAGLNNAAYQTSKAAVDMLTVLYAKELAADGIAVDAVGPGYRATDLNGGLPTPGAGDPADGAVVAVDTALDPDPTRTGRFLDYRGAEVPW